jgi:hypothetical protein
MNTAPTIVDVLENALDGDLSAQRARRLSMTEVRSLREVVLQFYDAWVPRPPPEDALRVHLGGWVASAASEGIAQDLLHASVLYAHETVIYDPVAAYFEPRRPSLRSFRPVQGRGLTAEASAVHLERTGGYEANPDSLDGHRSSLASAISQLATLAPLIRIGVVFPVPHLKLALQRQEKIWTAVRFLLADGDYLALVDQPVDRPPLTWDQGMHAQILTQPRTKADALIQQYGDAAHYLSRSIAVADAAYASYVPPSATEWAIYQQRLNRLGEVLDRKQRLDLTVAPALVQSKLPYFKGLADANLLGIRSNEESFENWREKLRSATRQITSLPGEGAPFADEARDVLKDALAEAASEVREATSRSSALRRSARPVALTLSTGAAGIAGEVALGGGTAAFGALGITGMLGWLLESLLPPGLTGSKAVMAHLVHDSAIDHDDDWPQREALMLTPKKRAGQVTTKQS